MHLPLHALLAMSTLLPASLVLAVNRPAVAQLPTTSDLTVEVTGLKNTDGQVCINVFAGSAGFLTEEGTLMQQCVLATESLAAAEISMDSSEDSSEEPSAEIPATPQPLSVTLKG
ncbi:MAG: hypothetical protein HC800_22065 [Phormidesmis sp. RL_2_1]|nr:hypothetical protein [Phormidesmis sp. RL_2_1]